MTKHDVRIVELRRAGNKGFETYYNVQYKRKALSGDWAPVKWYEDPKHQIVVRPYSNSDSNIDIRTMKEAEVIYQKTIDFFEVDDYFNVLKTTERSEMGSTSIRSVDPMEML